MDKEIKRLRKKFFLLTSVISFVVILVMMLILNVLMQLTYKKQIKTASDMLVQTACANTSDVSAELIYLSDVDFNKTGDMIIPRNPSTIKKIVLNGTITCSDESAQWFCAGGGIFFELADEKGNSRFIYKEYKFNIDNTKITIDFTDDSNFFCDGTPVDTDITKVSQSAFYISEVWWAASSSKATMGPNEDVTLNLESIEMHYLDKNSAASSQNFMAVSRSFAEIYPTGVPDTLNAYDCFYFITDKQGKLIEINNGNSATALSNKQALEMIGNTEKIWNINNKKYECAVKKNDTFDVYAFISNTESEQNVYTLLLISALSGGGVFVLVVIFAYFMSGRAVRTVSESYRKQKEFISNASHELKTPITVISATTELMEKKKGKDRLTECITVQTKKMAGLVNEMLSLTRLSATEKILSEFKSFDISTTVENAALYFESRAFEQKKQIITEIQENVTFNGNKDKIDELVGILIDNALKYSDDNSDIKITLRKVKDKIVITSENLCKDFDKNDIPHLFERFYRGDKSHSNEKEGFGLGLSIAKEIIELHKGTINVCYEENYVIFTVRL